MKRRLTLLLLLVICCYTNLKAKNAFDKKHRKIVIEVSLPSDYHSLLLPNASRDNIDLQVASINHVSLYPEWNYYQEKVADGKIKWVLDADTTMWMFSTVLGAGMVKPGDSIHVSYKEGKRIYSGVGFEASGLLNEIAVIRKGLTTPTRACFMITSVEDYLNWSAYCDKLLDSIMPLIESCKNKVSPIQYEIIKHETVMHIDMYDRITAFNALWVLFQKKRAPELSQTNLVDIFDSTQYKKWSKWLRASTEYWGNVASLQDFNRIETFKEFNFDANSDSINSKEKLSQYYYKKVNLGYNGMLRERLLAYVVSEAIIKELPITNPVRESLTKDYYAQKSFPKFREWVREIENHSSQLKNGDRVRDFMLVDKDGRSFTDNDFKGKFVLLNFWNSTCENVDQINQILDKISKEFSNDQGFSIVNISTDKDKKAWISRLEHSKYYNENNYNLYTGGQGIDHPMIKTYNVKLLPALYLMDEDGKLFEYSLSKLTNDNGKDLINTITIKRIKDQVDGPYVIYNDVRAEVSYAKENGEKLKFNDSHKSSLSVSTDEPFNHFSVTLKTELKPEPSLYGNVNKQLAISDIEGNFDSFRKLLQANGVIDKAFNWTYGSGHLVLVGDFVDRGKQVTEVLWLIYSLEEKARKAGGYVHFILGNHEIMNMQGDFRYVNKKYKNIVPQLNLALTDLYSEKSELGRWLRTKNIIEKIGDVLYVHGGISPSVNRLPLSIPEINNLVRPYYSKQLDSSNKYLLTLFDSKKTRTEISQPSPFWFRGYYENSDHLSEIPSIEQIDSTLDKFHAKWIVTGHSIINDGDKITCHYKDKVINLDTKHAKGKSEALSIVGRVFKRVNMEGKFEPLFENDVQAIFTKLP